MSAAAAGGLLAALLLTGCMPGSPGPSGSAMPTPTPTASPTGDPADSEPLAATVVIQSGLVGAVDEAENSIGLLDMFEPVPDVAGTVAEISGYFGFEPVSEFVEADPSGDGVSYTTYRWDGFELLDWELPASRVPAVPEFVVRATTADVRGVRLESIDGVAVGDDIMALEAANPGSSYRQDGEFGEEVLVRVDEREPVEGRYGPIRLAVELKGPVSGTVESIFSPSPDMQM